MVFLSYHDKYLPSSDQLHRSSQLFFISIIFFSLFAKKNIFVISVRAQFSSKSRRQVTWRFICCVDIRERSKQRNCICLYNIIFISYSNMSKYVTIFTGKIGTDGCVVSLIVQIFCAVCSIGSGFDSRSM